jgi:hypothetical protein
MDWRHQLRTSAQQLLPAIEAGIRGDRNHCGRIWISLVVFKSKQRKYLLVNGMAEG